MAFQPSILESGRTKLHEVPERGGIFKKEISRRAEGAADANLCRIQKNLKCDFFIDFQYRGADKTIQPRALRRARALGVMDYDGIVFEISEVERNADWDVPEEIEGFRGTGLIT